MNTSEQDDWHLDDWHKAIADPTYMPPEEPTPIEPRTDLEQLTNELARSGRLLTIESRDILRLTAPPEISQLRTERDNGPHAVALQAAAEIYARGPVIHRLHPQLGDNPEQCAVQIIIQALIKAQPSPVEDEVIAQSAFDFFVRPSANQTTHWNFASRLALDQDHEIDPDPLKQWHCAYLDQLRSAIPALNKAAL